MKPKDLINNTKNLKYIYTHCEIHPSTIFGILASCIPFPEHNQSPRNTYQAAMGKQAMGVYVTNFDKRMDKTAYVLNYPMRPLVDTRVMNIIQVNKIPSGSNVIVAIMTHGGFNQEDSLLFNAGSIARGLFQATIYHTEKDEDKKVNGDEEIRGKPDPSKTRGMKFGNYNKINSKGVIPENTLLENRDIIIAKVTPIKENRNDHTKVIKYEDCSKSFRTHEETYVDKNCIARNGDGYNFAKVRIRTVRKPVIGDKFCHDDKTEILTQSGWKFFNKLHDDDYVATLINNNELKYEKPTEIVEFDCDEDIYYIKTNQVDLAVTLNHRMYVGNRDGKNYKVELAKDILNKRKKYLKNVEKYNVNNTQDTFILEEYKNYDKKEINMNAFLVIFGIWIAEGWVDKYKRIYFAAHKQRVKDSLEENFRILGYDIIKTKDRKNETELNRWCICDAQLRNVFSNINKGAIYKYLPEWVWDLNMEQSKLLLTSMVIGDGHYMKNGTMRYDTSSVQLCDDFQKLALHSGYSANLYLRYKKGHETYSKTRDEIFRQTVDSFRLTIITKQNNPLVNKNINKEKTNAQDTIKNYKGKVYCCTVPSGIVYIRRNGKPVWTGNSSRH
jgi:transcriptional antiterminator Rof (Rho-off)